MDQALHRLVASGKLRRIARGLYDLPGTNRLTGKPTSPDPRAVIDALARKNNVRVLVDGITAANDLGLTDAVPARITVLTDARLRPVSLGKLTIDFQPRPRPAVFTGLAAPRCALCRRSIGCATCSPPTTDNFGAVLFRFSATPITGKQSATICAPVCRLSRSGCARSCATCFTSL